MPLTPPGRHAAALARGPPVRPGPRSRWFNPRQGVLMGLTCSYWPADTHEPVLEMTAGGVLGEAATRKPGRGYDSNVERGRGSR
jgi:hypothetical protein